MNDRTVYEIRRRERLNKLQIELIDIEETLKFSRRGNASLKQNVSKCLKVFYETEECYNLPEGPDLYALNKKIFECIKIGLYSLFTEIQRLTELNQKLIQQKADFEEQQRKKKEEKQQQLINNKNKKGKKDRLKNKKLMGGVNLDDSGERGMEQIEEPEIAQSGLSTKPYNEESLLFKEKDLYSSLKNDVEAHINTYKQKRQNDQGSIEYELMAILKYFYECEREAVTFLRTKAFQMPNEDESTFQEVMDRYQRDQIKVKQEAEERLRKIISRNRGKANVPTKNNQTTSQNKKIEETKVNINRKTQYSTAGTQTQGDEQIRIAQQFIREKTLLYQSEIQRSQNLLSELQESRAVVEDMKIELTKNKETELNLKVEVEVLKKQLEPVNRQMTILSKNYTELYDKFKAIHATDLEDLVSRCSVQYSIEMKISILNTLKEILKKLGVSDPQKETDEKLLFKAKEFESQNPGTGKKRSRFNFSLDRVSTLQMGNQREVIMSELGNQPNSHKKKSSEISSIKRTSIRTELNHTFSDGFQGLQSVAQNGILQELEDEQDLVEELSNQEIQKQHPQKKTFKETNQGFSISRESARANTFPYRQPTVSSSQSRFSNHVNIVPTTTPLDKTGKVEQSNDEDYRQLSESRYSTTTNEPNLNKISSSNAKQESRQSKNGSSAAPSKNGLKQKLVSNYESGLKADAEVQTQNIQRDQIYIQTEESLDIGAKTKGRRQTTVRTTKRVNTQQDYTEEDRRFTDDNKAIRNMSTNLRKINTQPAEENEFIKKFPGKTSYTFVNKVRQELGSSGPEGSFQSGKAQDTLGYINNVSSRNNKAANVRRGGKDKFSTLPVSMIKGEQVQISKNGNEHAKRITKMWTPATNLQNNSSLSQLKKNHTESKKGSNLERELKEVKSSRDSKLAVEKRVTTVIESSSFQKRSTNQFSGKSSPQTGKFKQYRNFHSEMIANGERYQQTLKQTSDQRIHRNDTHNLQNIQPSEKDAGCFLGTFQSLGDHGTKILEMACYQEKQRMLEQACDDPVFQRELKQLIEVTQQYEAQRSDSQHLPLLNIDGSKDKIVKVVREVERRHRTVCQGSNNEPCSHLLRFFRSLRLSAQSKASSGAKNLMKIPLKNINKVDSIEGEDSNVQINAKADSRSRVNNKLRVLKVYP